MDKREAGAVWVGAGLDNALPVLLLLRGCCDLEAQLNPCGCRAEKWCLMYPVRLGARSIVGCTISKCTGHLEKRNVLSSRTAGPYT